VGCCDSVGEKTCPGRGKKRGHKEGEVFEVKMGDRKSFTTPWGGGEEMA